MPRKIGIVAPLPAVAVEKICSFCGLKDDNELEYGQFHEYDGIVTHYYCLLLSSNMQQRGTDDEGILGFLPEDINQELKRGRKLACCYCKKIGATLGCCNTKCKRIFHLPCGLKSGSLHQFFGEYKSFCKTHRPIQTIDRRAFQEVKDVDTKICYICYDEVNSRDMLRTLWAPCCKKNAWFHRACVQRLAVSAGYFFKCPLCNNKAEFHKAMLDHGIFIPSQDASWELVPNAFEELLYRHNRCDARNCLCPKGREHVSTNAKWELTLCRTCGSQGIHMACGGLKWVKPIWECSECTSILNKTVTSNNSGMRSLRSRSGTDRSDQENDRPSDDESSDSDISVGGIPDVAAPTPADSTAMSESDDTEGDHIATRLRRGSHAKTISSTRNVVMNHESTRSRRKSEEIPPIPKKPRLSATVIRPSERDTDNSDDDIMVISGPSQSGVATDTEDEMESRVNQFERVFVDPPIEESHKDDGTNDQDRERRTIENSDNSSRIPTETLTRVECNVAIRPSSGTVRPPSSGTMRPSGTVRPPPVEIDLSDGEITVPKNHFASQNISLGEVPELNIKISNVTSLPPEAFELEPEPKNTTRPTLSSFCMTNGGSSQDPIIIDEKSMPMKSCNSNMINDSIHEEMKIVRFEGVEPLSHSKAQSIIYGLTIPGTNHTVPFIVSPPENCISNTPGIHRDPSSPLGISLCDCNSSHPPSFTDLLKLSVFNGSMTNGAMNTPIIKTPAVPNILRKPENQSSPRSTTVSTKQIVPESTKQRIDRTTAPQSIDPKSWSVPLKSIVKGTITKPHSSSTNIADSADDNYASFIRMTVPSAKPRKTESLQGKYIATNGIDSSVASITSIASANTARSQEYTPDPQLYLRTPNGYARSTWKPSPSPHTKTLPPNGIVSSKHKSSNDSPRPKNANHKVWTEVNGSYVPVESDSEMIMNSQIDAATTLLQIQQSSPADNNGTIYRLINADQTDDINSSNNCHGDAGSAPAVRSTTVDPTNAGTGRPRSPASTCRLCAILEDWKGNRGKEPNEWRCDCPENVTTECPATTDGSTTRDRTGLMRKTINLRDIKFTVGGPNTVKMELYETYHVNIKVAEPSCCTYKTSNNAPDSSASTCRESDESSSGLEAGLSNDNNFESGENERLAKGNCSHDAIRRSAKTPLDRSDSNSKDCATTSETLTNRLQADAGSSGQDELKENRDPVPPSTNSMNATSVAERKSKTRPRICASGHSMRSLNEKKSEQEFTERIDTSPSKMIANATQRIGNSSEIRACKDTNEARTFASNEADASNSACSRTSTNDGKKNPKISVQFRKIKEFRMLDRNPSDTRESDKSTITDTEQFEAFGKRRRCGDVEDQIEDSGGTKNRCNKQTSDRSASINFTTTQRLVTDSKDSHNARSFHSGNKRRRSSNDRVSNKRHRSEKSETKHNSREHKHRDAASGERRSSEPSNIGGSERSGGTEKSHGTATSGEFLCCRVSIDLTRIREILAAKMRVAVGTKLRKLNDESLADKIDGTNPSESESFRVSEGLRARSRSFGRSAGTDRPRRNRPYIVKLKKSRSVDDLNNLSHRQCCAMNNSGRGGDCDAHISEQL